MSTVYFLFLFLVTFLIARISSTEVYFSENQMNEDDWPKEKNHPEINSLTIQPQELEIVKILGASSFFTRISIEKSHDLPFQLLLIKSYEYYLLKDYAAQNELLSTKRDLSTGCFS